MQRVESIDWVELRVARRQATIHVEGFAIEAFRIGWVLASQNPIFEAP